mmetsp:Transcript_7137/g.18235  ORF Transcript_7137/g.18235 Transcript_7137/m.18235 type:complete len:317 (+) Transcript_7137:307-1257(+)
MVLVDLARRCVPASKDVEGVFVRVELAGARVEELCRRARDDAPRVHLGAGDPGGLGPWHRGPLDVRHDQVLQAIVALVGAAAHLRPGVVLPRLDGVPPLRFLLAFQEKPQGFRVLALGVDGLLQNLAHVQMLGPTGGLGRRLRARGRLAASALGLVVLLKLRVPRRGLDHRRTGRLADDMLMLRIRRLLSRHPGLRGRDARPADGCLRLVTRRLQLLLLPPRVVVFRIGIPLPVGVVIGILEVGVQRVRRLRLRLVPAIPRFLGEEVLTPELLVSLALLAHQLAHALPAGGTRRELHGCGISDRWDAIDDGIDPNR